jgi:hypothetical protein
VAWHRAQKCEVRMGAESNNSFKPIRHHQLHQYTREQALKASPVVQSAPCRVVVACRGHDSCLMQLLSLLAYYNGCQEQVRVMHAQQGCACGCKATMCTCPSDPHLELEALGFHLCAFCRCRQGADSVDWPFLGPAAAAVRLTAGICGCIQRSRGA